MSDRADTVQANHEACVLDYYERYHREDTGRAALRCGLGDAAGLCDAMATDVERANTRGGKVNKEGKAVAGALRAAGDAIWKLREKVVTP